MQILRGENDQHRQAHAKSSIKTNKSSYIAHVVTHRRTTSQITTVRTICWNSTAQTTAPTGAAGGPLLTATTTAANACALEGRSGTGLNPFGADTPVQLGIIVIKVHEMVAAVARCWTACATLWKVDNWNNVSLRIIPQQKLGVQ